MTFVVSGPAGERRVKGRKRLYRTLAEMTEAERQTCTVSGGGQTIGGDAVYCSLAYRYDARETR